MAPRLPPQIQRERLVRSSASAHEPSRPPAWRIWLRRQRSLLRRVGMGIGMLLLAVALLLGLPMGEARQWREYITDVVGQLSESLGWRVEQVILEGRENTPLDMIRAALGVARGDPILTFSLPGARERLESIAWIERAHLERRLPSTILVRIEERRPFAIWQHEGRFVFIDREGRVIATDGLDRFGPLPLLVGSGAERHGAALYDVLKAWPEVGERVQAMVRIHDRRWNLRLRTGADVLLPEGYEAAAIARLAELQREVRLLDRPLATIDLRLPDRLVLRPLREREAGEPPLGQQQAARARRG